MLFRVVDILEWQYRSSKIVSTASSGLYRYTLWVLLTAAIWSIHTIIFMPHMSMDAFSFHFILLVSFAGVAVPILSPSRLISLLYGAIIIIPLGLIAITSEQQYQQLLGYIALPFSLLLIPICFKTSRHFNNAIELKYLNEQLAVEMQQEKKLVIQANQDLQQASNEISQMNAHLEEEVEKRTQQVVRLNNIDALTQLANRKAFTSNLANLIEQATNQRSSLALLFVDLNGFKKINDTMGHKVGDSVLIEVSQRISAFTESNPVGRWGGDEFLVSLPYSDEQTAMLVAKAMISSIEQPIYVNGSELQLSATIGIAIAPKHSTSAAELIQLADLTMCEQKSTSVASAQLFSIKLKEQIKASQMILEGLQHAISRHQLYLCYQPIVLADDKSPWAFEALLRWDFNGKFIGPDTFIPLAEKSGLIREIGAWVLNRACMDAQHWHNHSNAAVSVNVSVIQLMDDGFMRILDNCMRSSGLAAHRLHLEITESTFVENELKVLQQLEQIRARHIHVSIDDFGTGYSSLSQLQTLPVNYVKIDKKFVDNIPGKGEAIIRATQFIAKELNYKTIAEGVEDDQQAALLVEMGIDYLQGYNFAKPMKNEDLLNWQSPTKVISASS